MNNQEIIIKDKAIEKIEEDKFQRGNFSNSIAKSLIEWNDKHGFVVGIYGKWGEGKSSIINMVNAAIEIDNNIISFTYNPWRFSDENEVLISFFKLLAESLDQNLETKSEKAGKIIKEYSELLLPAVSLSFLKIDVPNQVKKLGSILSDTKLDQLKKRLEKILDTQKKKVVVFIDDVDRLNRTELQTIFKLVKLTGDFNFVSYILAFDPEIVAHSLGEIYGKGDKEAGYEYLEKIVQVPLQIPKAPRDSIRKFAMDKLIELLNTTGTNWGQFDGYRFQKLFENFILPSLDTPRSVIRYINNLTFSLSLIRNEVDLVDMLLIEAIKVSNAPTYNYIIDNKDLFLGKGIFIFDNEKREIKYKENEKDFENSMTNLKSSEKENLKNLISYVFPHCEMRLRTKDIFDQQRSTIRDHKYYFKLKRVCSEYFFDRYFNLSTPLNELPSHLLDFITTTPVLSKEQASFFGFLIDEYKPTEVLDRIENSLSKYMSLKEIITYIYFISESYDKFLVDERDYFIQSKNSERLSSFLINILSDISGKKALRLFKTLFDDELISVRFANRLLIKLINNVDYLRENEKEESDFYNSWFKVSDIELLHIVEMYFTYLKKDNGRLQDFFHLINANSSGLISSINSYAGKLENSLIDFLDSAYIENDDYIYSTLKPFCEDGTKKFKGRLTYDFANMISQRIIDIMSNHCLDKDLQKVLTAIEEKITAANK